MVLIYSNILETIGKTPLVKINKLNEGKAEIYAKVESFNPAGSSKDRIAYQMIKDYLDSGKITKDTLLIEPTSGNTGIGLAMVSAVLDMKLVLVMPANMSEERKKLIKGYGASLELTDPSLGMQGSIDRANELTKIYEDSIILQQFENPSNPKAHYLTTAKEIIDDVDVDIFIAGIGTGGTISGVAKYLKEKKPNTLVFGVEPLSSNILNGGKAGPHKLQGIGANFIPENLNQELMDAYIDVSDNDAIETSRKLMTKEGIAVGISSGAAMHAALEISKEEKYKNKKIVVLLADTAERYLSTELYDI
ncbi:MAG: cysteine synthase A [Erysipelotrichaceae bacterium]|nr:cysteine synthase A [Bacillota bacterium]NLP21429.1 cysteine synthase A [Erysipelotrichaceae bacterium]HCY06313.1 cysteine synthase A [Erysipelotrichaceae bacterium]